MLEVISQNGLAKLNDFQARHSLALVPSLGASGRPKEGALGTIVSILQHHNQVVASSPHAFKKVEPRKHRAILSTQKLSDFPHFQYEIGIGFII